jgi:pimeloyl-ACP methyl ester carboxylesterase
VIVAHSIGGYHARVFTHLYPEDVVGMILVDTTTLFPESMEAFATAYPTYFPDEASGITKNRILETDIYATLSPDMGPDGLDISASSEQVRQARSFGDLPLIVICHNITPDDWPGLDLDISERYAATARRLQAELASLSSRGEFIIARTKNHFISVTEPQIIIDAIDGMVEEIRNN